MFGYTGDHCTQCVAAPGKTFLIRKFEKGLLIIDGLSSVQIFPLDA
jgi:hypothetical protein